MRRFLEQSMQKSDCHRSSIFRSTARHRFNSLIRSALSLLLDKPPAVASHFSATLSRGEYAISEKEDVVMISDQNEFSLADSFLRYPLADTPSMQRRPDGKTSLLSERITHLANGSWQTVRIPDAWTIYVFYNGL